jgi:catechol 2,3-dioxygenase-like lactoylglutathione lyase family enzyme
MKPIDILETSLYVDNLTAAERFYVNIVGLELHSKKEGRHTFLKCDKRMLLLFNANETLKSSGSVPTHGTKGPGHIAFSIHPDEFDKWREHLVNNDVKIESEVDWDQGGHSIYFRDPSGNSVEITTSSIWGIE